MLYSYLLSFWARRLFQPGLMETLRTSIGIGHKEETSFLLVVIPAGCKTRARLKPQKKSTYIFALFNITSLLLVMYLRLKRSLLHRLNSRIKKQRYLHIKWKGYWCHAIRWFTSTTCVLMSSGPMWDRVVSLTTTRHRLHGSHTWAAEQL